MYFVLTVAALTENRNCISVDMCMVSTRFIESKVRVVTSLNKDKDPEPSEKEEETIPSTASTETESPESPGY